MKRNNNSREIGFYKFLSLRTNCEFIWDERQEVLTFKLNSKHNIISIRLDTFSNFKEDAKGERIALIPEKLDAVEETLIELIESRLWISDDNLYRVLTKFAYFLCRFHFPATNPQTSDRSFMSRFDPAKIFKNLTSREYETTWLIIYNNNLSFQQRINLLQLACENFKKDSESTSVNLKHKARVRQERELYWWTIICYFDLALKWFDNHRHHEPLAKEALYDASISYLQILKDDPRQESLQNFLKEMKSDIEKEVETIFGINNKVSSVLKDDEVINRTFITWFLKRYNYKAARKLNKNLGKQDSNIGQKSVKKKFFAEDKSWLVTLCWILFVISGSLFGIQAYWSFEITEFQILWFLQIIAQLAIPFILLLSLPGLVKLFFPKAVFGTLLAWTTVFITAIPDLQGLEFRKTILIENCECESTFNIIIFLAVFFIITTLLSSLFILYFVTQFTATPLEKIKRTMPPLIALLLSSLYWGIMFTLPVNHLLHSKVQTSMFTPIPKTVCFLAITITGSMLAIFFGLLIQLIWQNESIAEPLGDPI